MNTETQKRYFAIAHAQGRGLTFPVAMADADALGRVLASMLGGQIPGACKLKVWEVSEETFQAFRAQVGTIPV